MSVKLWTNRNVFNWCLNRTREETVRRDVGRLFHARGAATGKARSPRVDLCNGGTTSVVVVDDSRWWRLSTSAVRRMFSVSYAGAELLRQWCVRTQRRNVICSGTRSQWSSRSDALGTYIYGTKPMSWFRRGDWRYLQSLQRWLNFPI